MATDAPPDLDRGDVALETESVGTLEQSFEFDGRNHPRSAVGVAGA